jgi:tRNA(Ile)-lysidine synthase
VGRYGGEGQEAGSPLPDALQSEWAAGGWADPGDRVVVACSGGVDSMVLLHLLCFPLRGLVAGMEAAHFDHRMRPGSAGDGVWLRGVTRAWGVPLLQGRASRVPEGEAEARRMRYDFLERAREEAKARWVLTAHHADDQVETVLFRIVRGTGIHGLRGIPRVRSPGVLRPLLSFPRARVEAWAREARVPFREDPTNRLRDFRRNRIRLDLVPLLKEIHPGAREAILRLARNAARTEAALEALVEPLARTTILDRGEHFVEMDREALLELPLPVRRAVLRHLAREVGPPLSEPGTGLALEFITTAPSGGRVSLAGSVILSRDFGTFRLGRTAAGSGPGKAGPLEDDGGDAPTSLAISVPDEGQGRLQVGSRCYRVRWGSSPLGPDADERTEAFDPQSLRFPLQLRGWEPGDRTRTTGGGKKLKKLFGELQVPRDERWSLLVVADGTGEVVWIPGVHRSPTARCEPPAEPWTMGVSDVTSA